jgi:CBS domain-containing protein
MTATGTFIGWRLLHQEEPFMKASDIMVTDVISVKPDSEVQDVAALLLAKQISAVPVVDNTGALVGIVSEGDLLRRGEAGTGHERAWWLKLLMSRENLAAEFVKEHARKVADVMTRDVISADPDTPVADIATQLERYRIKRMPIVRNGRLVGIVSRANLIQALAAFRKKTMAPRSVADAELREKLVSRLKSEPWVRPNLVNVTVTDGTVDLWGIVDSSVEKQALRVAVEVTPGVRSVNDNVTVRPLASGE